VGQKLMVKDEDENLKETKNCDVDDIYGREEAKPYLISSSLITILVKACNVDSHIPNIKYYTLNLTQFVHENYIYFCTYF